MPRRRSNLEESRPEPGIGSVVEYLQTASPVLLQEFELHCLNHVANLQKEVVALLERITEQKAEARLARLLLEHGKTLVKSRKAVALSPAAETIAELIVRVEKEPKLLNTGRKENP